MKNFNKFISLLAAVTVAISLFSCGEKMTLKPWESDADANVNAGTKVVNKETIIGELKGAITDIKNSVLATCHHGYQYSNANSVDVFAGYTTVNHSDFQYGPILEHTYMWPNGYYGSACSVGPTAGLKNAYFYAEANGVPEYKAIAQIVYAQTALHAVNNSGAIAYHDSRSLKETRPLTFLSIKETYDAILTDLDEAIQSLELIKPGKESLVAVEGDGLKTGAVEIAYSNYDYKNWVRLALAVKLRIAMYLSKPDEELARRVAQEVEAAEAKYGTIEIDFGPGWKSTQTQHPAFEISSTKLGWADSRMNASAENILKRTASPLIGKYFSKNVGAIKNIRNGVQTAEGKDYCGIRQGTAVGIKTSGQRYYQFSEISNDFRYSRLLWTSVEEVIFLKAEAALRWGLFGGDAKSLYEKGVRSALAKYGVEAEANTYLSSTEPAKIKEGRNWIDIDYKDAYDKNNDCKGRYNLGVKWDDYSDKDDITKKEENLERLITQKWIAIFPNGYEAWTDFRRTGYPRLFTSVTPWTTGDFDVEIQLRRIPTNTEDENVRQDIPQIEMALSIPEFGVVGKNSAGQRLYFDGDPKVYPWSTDEKGWFKPVNFVK